MKYHPILVGVNSFSCLKVGKTPDATTTFELCSFIYLNVVLILIIAIIAIEYIVTTVGKATWIWKYWLFTKFQYGPLSLGVEIDLW